VKRAGAWRPRRERGRGRTARAASRARPRAGAVEDRARVGVEEIHADLLEDAERRLVQRLELVGGDDLDRREAPPRLAERPRLGRLRRACGAAAAARAATLLALC
jgi:hypothetical protein